jgi:phospholipid-binding lipoprotein MlaA
VDGYTWPPTYLQEPRDRNSLFLVKQIDFRASLLPAERSIEGIGIDRYQFIRDVYLQRRRNLISDGAEPEEPAKPPTYEDPEDEADKKGEGKPDKKGEAKPDAGKPAADPSAAPAPPSDGSAPAQPK